MNNAWRPQKSLRTSKVVRTGLATIHMPFRKVPVHIPRRVSSISAIEPHLIQTWEVNSFGRRHWNELMGIRTRNPSLAFTFFDRASRDNYMLEIWGRHPIFKIYKRSVFGAQAVDVFRYCYILDRGGFYLDISKGFRGSISDMLEPDKEGLISFENNSHNLEEVNLSMLEPAHRVIQWFFGFRKGSEVLKAVIEEIIDTSKNYSDVIFEDPKAAILQFTGPEMFTRVFHKAFEHRGKLETVQQLGIDFSGRGVFQLPGATARLLRYPSYSSEKNSRILFPENGPQ